ncbi:MAG: pinensin family lanthipeptide [Bacteroidota bacterium]
MKKRKIRLENLEVKSFVTTLHVENIETLKGGTDSDVNTTAYSINALHGCETDERLGCKSDPGTPCDNRPPRSGNQIVCLPDEGGN